jgi:flagellar hook-length control protein FliK
MIQLSSALLEPAAPAPHGSEPPGSPPDTPFSAVLDDHQARTAVAEGHQQKRGDAPRGSDADDDGRDPTVDRGAATTGPAVDGDANDDRAKPAEPASPQRAALAALLGGVPLPAGVKLTAVAIATTPQGEATANARSSPAVGPAGLATAAVGTTTPMPTGPTVPAAATTLPLRPPVPAAPGADGAPGTAVADAATEQPLPAPAAASIAAARATRLADVLQSATARPAGTGATANAPGSAAAATPPAATVAGAAARSSGQASDQGTTNGSAPQPAPVVPAQPAAPVAEMNAPAGTAAATHGVGLEHAVETVRLALRAAADRGVTHARISLTPRELGSIEVHLRQTAEGLVARVVAEHATAAQLLHNAGGELRRQLESQGLTLLRLDIGASGEQGGRAADRQALANGGGAFADGDGDGSGRTRGDETDPLAALGTADQTSTTTTLALPNGALVDVLA